MQKFDWIYTIRSHILMLKIMGLQIKSDEKPASNLYKLYTFFSVVVIMGVHNFFQTVNIYFVYKDLEVLTPIIVVTSTCILVSVKIYFLQRNISIVNNLILSLNGDLYQPKTEKQRRNAELTLYFFNFVYLSFFSLAVMSSTAWLLIPILSNGTQDKQLPFSAWYPYDCTISPLYEFTYIYQCVATFYLVTTVVHIDTLILFLIMYITIQCDNLCDDLKNLRHDLYNINERMIACVKHHQAILSSAVDSNKFFDKTILGQFVTTTVTFAVNMFQLSLVANLSREGVNSVFNAMAVITQIFIYCWFGEELQIKVGII
ncbi:hypothetical protein Zmor_007612 [Zophobas morio]|uniref:7tm 6 domain containing protein n=1 Tax=Zophobas morio TaxID=2755281 RepID=A0AA38IYN1_9CUCU|nr:hypothetical protein Zmor_007612 [Zophobas morio]